MEIFPLSDWLKPRLGKKYNAIATSGDVIRGRYNARLVSRQILLVADNVIDVSSFDATYVFIKHWFREIHVIKQLFYFFLGKYDGYAPLEKQYSPRPSG